MPFRHPPSTKGQVHPRKKFENTSSNVGNGLTRLGSAMQSVLRCFRKRQDKFESSPEKVLKTLRASILSSKDKDERCPSAPSNTTTAVATLLEDLISIHGELSSPRLTTRSGKSIESSLKCFTQHTEAATTQTTTSGFDMDATLRLLSRSSEYFNGFPTNPEENEMDSSSFSRIVDADADATLPPSLEQGSGMKKKECGLDNDENQRNNDTRASVLRSDFPRSSHLSPTFPSFGEQRSLNEAKCVFLLDLTEAWTHMWNAYFPPPLPELKDEDSVIMEEDILSLPRTISSESEKCSLAESENNQNSVVRDASLDEEIEESREDIIPFQAWIRERVDYEAEDMTDEIAKQLHDKLPKAYSDALSSSPSSSSSLGSARSMSEDERAFKIAFNREWDNLLSKVGESGLMSTRSVRKQRMSGTAWAVKLQWDKVLKFLERWRLTMEHDEALHRYIWTLALREVALIDYQWRWPLVLTHKDLKNARNMHQNSMLQLIESVDSWEEACKLSLHLILSPPMLRKLASRLSSRKLQNVDSCEDADAAIMWFCLSGRTWWQVGALVRTKAFAEYKYYAKLFQEDLTETEEKRVKLEKNIYRFLQLGRLEFAAGVLVLTGRHEDAERMLVQRESDFSLSVFISRLRLES